MYGTVMVVLILMLRPLWADEEGRYVPDPDPLVRQRIEAWRDLKFGLLMHWGPYSQWGIVESWSICPEDEDWCVPETVTDYFEYKTRYENLPKTFNPVQFDPAKWARAARAAGMKYVVFTTKHHDGFCMFDTRTTDYRITAPDCPFSRHPRADITREIFDAFRGEGFWVGAYFSKPDWHSPDYWWPQFPPFDRHVNYDIDRYPERWERFVQFTHHQVLELCRDYGPLDILWLDGGWVRKLDPDDHPPVIPGYTVTKDGATAPPAGAPARPRIPGYVVKKRPNQDIRMDELVARARAVRPGLIVVDRAVPGRHQNYLTPENRIPDGMLPYPWESCIIMGGGWSFAFDAEMKPSRELIHMLVDIVAKGGNLLLNIGPGPDGTWYPAAYDRLRDMGDWLAVHGAAIYGTRVCPPYVDGPWRFTRAQDGAVYAIRLLDEGEARLPEALVIPRTHAAARSLVTLVGAAGTPLAWENRGDDLVVTLPAEVNATLPSGFAVALRIE
ncbi:MAG: alpha-L-fucosidase [Acidobacteria bacterium]|nr:alpha-L-fucosidase [Acidobacteriota bacterium]